MTTSSVIISDLYPSGTLESESKSYLMERMKANDGSDHLHATEYVFLGPTKQKHPKDVHPT